MSPMLVLTSSMNPSRGPLMAMAVCGSATARRDTFFVPSTSAPRTPSMSSAGLPAKISSAAPATSSASFTSGKSILLRQSSSVSGASPSASGRAASSPSSCLSVMPSAYTAAQAVPSPAANSYTRMSSAGSSSFSARTFSARSAPKLFCLEEGAFAPCSLLFGSAWQPPLPRFAFSKSFTLQVCASFRPVCARAARARRGGTKRGQKGRGGAQSAPPRRKNSKSKKLIARTAARRRRSCRRAGRRPCGRAPRRSGRLPAPAGFRCGAASGSRRCPCSSRRPPSHRR